MVMYALVLCAFIAQSLSGMEDPRKDEPSPSTNFVNYDNRADALDAITNKKHLPADQYHAMVQNIPISCVDIFVYDPAKQSYFIVDRSNKPAQGIQWIPGGRQIIFESYSEAARRKCKEEDRLDVLPIVALGHYTTQFPDSQSDSPTHTNNLAMLALLEPGSEADLDNDHRNAQWVSLTTSPVDERVFGHHVEHLYLYDIWLAALAAIDEHQELIKRLTSNERERTAYRSRIENVNAYEDTRERYNRIHNLHNVDEELLSLEAVGAQRIWATLQSFESEHARASARARLEELFNPRRVQPSEAHTLSREARIVSTLWALIPEHEQASAQRDLVRILRTPTVTTANDTAVTAQSSPRVITRPCSFNGPTSLLFDAEQVWLSDDEDWY